MAAEPDQRRGQQDHARRSAPQQRVAGRSVTISWGRSRSAGLWFVMLALATGCVYLSVCVGPSLFVKQRPGEAMTSAVRPHAMEEGFGVCVWPHGYHGRYSLILCVHTHLLTSATLLPNRVLLVAARVHALLRSRIDFPTYPPSHLGL